MKHLIEEAEDTVRKKSHILLARYLADQMPLAVSLQEHRKAFCLGSIMPDLKPSFITQRHEYYGTFWEIQEKMKRLVNIDPKEYTERVYWRHFGEVIHYIADYFTFPHNRTYTGNFLQHNHYENELKIGLKKCIVSGEADFKVRPAKQFSDLTELVEYIKHSHDQYLKKARNVTEDIDYILNVCYQVIQGLFQLCMKSCYEYAGVIA